MESPLSGRKDFGKISTCWFWAIMVVLLGSPDVPVVPTTHTGKFVAFSASIFSYLSVAVLCGIITTKLSFGSVPGRRIAKLDDLPPGGRLCVEGAYPLAEEFVARNAPDGITIVRGPVAKCIQSVMEGSVDAFMTDELVIRWRAPPRTPFFTRTEAISPDIASGYRIEHMLSPTLRATHMQVCE